MELTYFRTSTDIFCKSGKKSVQIDIAIYEYFNITDTLIFEDRMIKLDMLPKYYFKEIIDVLYTETFSRDNNLRADASLETISEAFKLDISKVYAALSKDLGITIKSPE